MPNYFHSRTGVPLPTLQWYKDAVSIGTLQNPRYKLLSSGGLRIQGLRPEDSGIFQCFASNEGGEIQTYTYLDVTSEYCPSAKPDPQGWTLSRTFPPFVCVTHLGNGSICSANGQGAGAVESHLSGQQEPMCWAASTPRCPHALAPHLLSGEPRTLLSTEKQGEKHLPFSGQNWKDCSVKSSFLTFFF